MLPLRIAFRYLFARKSFNVINMISGIGIAGMAIGTASLIVILSVFNGFNALVTESLTDAGADLQIRPASGKVFVPEGPAYDWAMGSEDVIRLSSALQEQVFVTYEGRQSLARVKGLDIEAEVESALQEHVIDGVWSLHRGSLPQAVAGAGLAHSLGLNPRFVTPMQILYPSRTEAVSLANPSASLRSVNIQTAGIISVNAELDNQLLLVPIETLRQLLEYPEEVSTVDIWTAPGHTEAVQKQLQELLGPSVKVLDRYQQNQSIYRMMRYEKLAIFLILVFVVLLVAFNIYSALKMLIIEKQDDMQTLRAMGADEPLIRRIFRLEGLLLSLVGLAIGLVLGLLMVWLQRRFGLVGMPGNFAVTAYPVILKAGDVLLTVAAVALTGLLMALIPTTSRKQ